MKTKLTILIALATGFAAQCQTNIWITNGICRNPTNYFTPLICADPYNQNTWFVPVTVNTELATNVVTGDNQKGCSVCEMLRISPQSAVYHPSHLSDPWREADERWAITNVVRQVTFTFQWEGRKFTHREEVPVSSITNRWKLVTVTNWKIVTYDK